MSLLTFKQRKMKEDFPDYNQEDVEKVIALVRELRGDEMVRMLDDIGWFDFVRPTPYEFFGIYNRELRPSTVAIMLKHIFLYSPKVLYAIARRKIAHDQRAIAKTDFQRIVANECHFWKNMSLELIDAMIGSEFEIVSETKKMQLIRPKYLTYEEKKYFNERLETMHRELYVDKKLWAIEDDEGEEEKEIKHKDIRDLIKVFDTDVRS